MRNQRQGPRGFAGARTLRLPLAIGVVAGLVLCAATSGAATLGSAVLLSTDAHEIDCFVSNVGGASVKITGVSINNGGNTLLSLSANSCVGALGPGSNCVFSADLDARFSARGSVAVRGSVKKLRGQCQLTSSSNHIVATTDLR